MRLGVTAVLVAIASAVPSHVDQSALAIKAGVSANLVLVVVAVVLVLGPVSRHVLRLYRFLEESPELHAIERPAD